MEKKLYKELRSGFVVLFKLVSNNVQHEFYNKHAITFATNNLNATSCLEFIKDYDDNENDAFEISYFKEHRDEIELLKDEVKKEIISKIDYVYDICRSIIINQSECDEVKIEDKIDIIMKDKMFKKLIGISGKKINKKKFTQMVENNPHLKKMFEGNIPESIDSQFDFLKDLLGNDIPFLNDDLIKELLHKIENKDTKQLFINVIEKIKLECPEIKEDISNLIKIFDNDETKELVTSLLDNIKDIKNFNIQSLMEKVQEIGSINEVFWKVQNVIESGLINIEKLKQTLHKCIRILMEELVMMSIISKEEQDTIFQFMDNPTATIPTKMLFKRKNNQKTKTERKERRIKNYRRKKKKELKKKKTYKKRRA